MYDKNEGGKSETYQISIGGLGIKSNLIFDWTNGALFDESIKILSFW